MDKVSHSFFFSSSIKLITLATQTDGDLFGTADRQPFEQLNIFSEQITLAVPTTEYFLNG